VALAVLATSGWPVFYASERMGRNRRRFLMWKFRTMVTDADDVFERWKLTHRNCRSCHELALDDDPRTPLGPSQSALIAPALQRAARRDGWAASVPGRIDRAVAVAGYPRGEARLTGRSSPRRKGLGPTARMEIEAGYVSELGLVGDLRYVARTVQPLIKMDGH
jgi:lipopolysaccharide/colanic/teichoic acid biosynthesis glycosyltransferase